MKETSKAKKVKKPTESSRIIVLEEPTIKQEELVDTTLFHDHLKRTNGKARIKTKSFLDLKALQEERKEAQQRFAALESQLKHDELALVAALEAGFEPEPGCPPVKITTDSEIRPKWKDEAIKLAVQDGLNPEVYVATVRSTTTPTKYKHIVVETPPKK